MTWRRTIFPHYYQRNSKGKLVEVVVQRNCEKVEYEEIEVNEQGISREYFETIKKLK